MPAANNALAKYGAGQTNSAVVRYQLWFGAGLFLKRFSVSL